MEQDEEVEETSGATDRASGVGAQPGGKSRYHHGDLRNALIRAAMELAREGGPDAVVLRAAAREVGVSATAAYRHFAGRAELLGAVGELCQEYLGARMEEAGNAVPSDDPDAGVERVRALGRGYIHCAITDPGLFRTAFCHRSSTAEPTGDEAAAHPDGRLQTRFFRRLGAHLDAMVDSGHMSPERRQGAELSAGAVVHGIAMLVLDGPLGGLTPEEVVRVGERAVRDVLHGLTSD